MVHLVDSATSTTNLTCTEQQKVTSLVCINLSTKFHRIFSPEATVCKVFVRTICKETPWQCFFRSVLTTRCRYCCIVSEFDSDSSSHNSLLNTSHYVSSELLLQPTWVSLSSNSLLFVNPVLKSTLWILLHYSEFDFDY
jgi:hypothetical protein